MLDRCTECTLPAVEVIVPHALGQIRHVIRAEMDVPVNAISEVKISARTKEPICRRSVITALSLLPKPVKRPA
jgi:hypothetical protein